LAESYKSSSFVRVDISHPKSRQSFKLKTRLGLSGWVLKRKRTRVGGAHC
jgi:hypothetical protein